MATKKDLIEAQSFSRRRLLTAFTSGAPGGKELEPAKPLRAVIAGVAMAIMVIVGGLFYGYLSPPLGEGWEDNKVILVKDTGARYFTIDGVLHPILNATSARLLIPAGGTFKPLVVGSAAIKDKPIGVPIGIVGAPDDVPPAASLVPTAWTACTTVTDTGPGVALSIPGDATAVPGPGAALVTTGDDTYVVSGDTAFLVDADSRDAVVRAIGLSGVEPLAVDSRWLNLFAAGGTLEPVIIEGAGDEVEGTELLVGTVVKPQGSTDRFVITAEGTTAKLSELAWQLYQLGTGTEFPGEYPVTQGELNNLGLAQEPAGGADWPESLLVPMISSGSICALLQHGPQGEPITVLSTTATPQVDGVTVQVGGGALVYAGGEGADSFRNVFLVDSTGTSFAVPGADSDADLLPSLGYTPPDVSFVTTAWMQFFAAGPELTRVAAGSSPVSAGGDGSSLIEPTATPEATPDATPDATGGPITDPSSEPSGEPSSTSSPGPTASSSTSADALLYTEACKTGDFIPSQERGSGPTTLQGKGLATVATGAGVVVAVVDSGIDASNPHLVDAVIGGINLVGDGEREDGLSDLAGHGTAIAGMIAARPVEGSSLVGLAPDAQLLSVRVFAGTDEDSVEAGFGPDFERQAEGIRWAVDNGATIINVSMSDPNDVEVVRQAVAYAVDNGVLVVASAGNRNTSDDKTDSPRYPAAYPGVLAVAAADVDGFVTYDSIHGAHVDVSAPGRNVYGAQTGGLDCLFGSENASTSYATAFATASAAIVAQAHPDETPEQWSYRLMATAIRLDPDARDDLAGWGLVQPLDAINLIPGDGERGPQSPFTSAGPAVVGTEVVALTTHIPADPMAGTNRAALGAAVLAAFALGTFAVLAAYRRNKAASLAAADAGGAGGLGAGEPARQGLLDSRRSELTKAH